VSYDEFLKTKTFDFPDTGVTEIPELSPSMFPFQRDITRWALRKGRAAIWADCGLGKTIMQLEWARVVPGNVLILAPLAVAGQTVAEAEKFGIPGVKYQRRGKPSGKITITNYEMLEHFNPADFDGIVLDESSILKSFDGKTRNTIINAFGKTAYKLACTATPAPNDYMELGNHAEFLGVMTRCEMLSMFFVHDGGETQKWRLKGHAREEYWRWVASWAVMIRKPSDLGYSDEGFDLPTITIHNVTVPSSAPEGFLFAMEAKGLQGRIRARKASLTDRVQKCAELINGSEAPWLIWCNLNDESKQLGKAIEAAEEVKGSDSLKSKETRLNGFKVGQPQILVSKPRIAGFGMNYQHCANVAFVGLSDSWEQYYQAVRRVYRFGQKNPVNVYIIASEAEGSVVANIMRKEQDAAAMAEEMTRHMALTSRDQVHDVTPRTRDAYVEAVETGDGYRLYLGDCVEVLRTMPAESVDYSIFSPPFSSLYTYSASARDVGNCRDDEEFFRHMKYVASEIFRTTMPGRLCSFHCMLLPSSKAHHGYIGLRDFRGDMIRVFRAGGWIHHSEVVIWKDPVTAMQRTKALGLLWKQLKKDSCRSRNGIPDYVVTMRKPGVNPNPVSHSPEDFPVAEWQKIASPIWMDIRPNDTIQFRSAREHDDERHICPLQLEVIRRCLKLWTRRGDTVLSPFAGIGSEGHVALEMGRRFVGVELKKSYWRQAHKNLEAAIEARAQGTLFG
jgi:superfamily II DNA or RNA helicase